MKKKDNRIVWLDFANVVAMVAVVWFHIPSSLEMPIRHLEYVLVNVPFFALAGCSFALANKQQQHWKTFIIGIFKSLILPTCCFYFFFYLLWVLFGRNIAGDTVPLYIPLFDFLKGNFNYVLETYWFVICLFFMQIIFYSLEQLQMRWISLCYGMFPLITILPIPDYYQINNVLLFFPFFALGCKCYQINMSDKSSIIECVLIVLGLIVNSTILYVTGQSIGYNCKEFFLGLVFLGVIIAFSKCLDGRIKPRLTPILRYGALVLLATQNYIIGIVKVVLDNVFSGDNVLANHIELKPLLIVFIYLCSIPIILLINNRFPFILGKRCISYESRTKYSNSAK